MTPKKILILGKIPPPYMGPAIATEILLNSGLKERYNLLHLDTRAHQDINELGKFSIKKIFRNITIYFSLYSLIKKESPHLVLIPISQTTIGFLKDSLFIVTSRLAGAKILIQLRGSGFKDWYDHATSFIRSYVRKVLGHTQGVIVLGNNLKYLFRDFFNDEQIYVAPNGANYDIPAPIRNDKNKIKLIYLANLQASKGIEDVIRAIVFLNQAMPGTFVLDVIGNWRDEKTKSTLMELVSENKLPVNFPGPSKGSEKFRLLSSSDIFLFTPREPEGHPWVIVEAMACGLPIISTDQGAIIESVINGENGFIVPVSDPNAIFEKIKLLINNKDLRIRMGQLSKEYYLQKFTETQLVENYSKAFEKAILG